MATAIIGLDVYPREIVIDAGGDPARAEYADGLLTVPDVSQQALDNAVAAYDPPVGEDRALDAQFNDLAITNRNFQLYLETTFDLTNRVRVLEGLAPLTQNQFVTQQRDAWKDLARR